MMLRIGLGLGARPLGPLHAQPVRGLTISVLADGMDVPVGVSALMLKVSGSSVHAGSHRLETALLAQGPVCLVAPAIRAKADGSAIEADAGLWACDASAGAAGVARQWLAGGTPVPGETGLLLAWRDEFAGRAISLVETVRQGAAEVPQASAAAVFPGPQTGSGLVVLPDATLEIALQPGGQARFAVTRPAAHAGSYDLDSDDLATGPVWLAGPVVSGGTLRGSTLTAVPGLPVHDAEAGAMTVTGGQWHRGGTPIAGATALAYTIVAADQGHDLTFRQTASDGNGSRTGISNPIGVALPGVLPDTFDTAASDLNGLTTESGEAWRKVTSTGSIQIAHGAAWGRTAHAAYVRGAALRGPSQYAAASIRRGTGWQGSSPAVCIQDTASLGAYVARIENGRGQIQRRAGTVETNLVQKTFTAAEWPVGETRLVELERLPSGTLNMYVGGVLFLTATDTTFTDGGIGLVTIGSAVVNGTDLVVPLDFIARTAR